MLYRLKVIAVKTPPLRERRTDIPVLARHFVQIHGKGAGRPVRGLSAEAESMLMNYDWPGNVRELQNAIERAIVLGSGDWVLPEDLPTELYESGGGGSPMPKFHEVLNAAKRDLIEKAFAHAGGDYKKAAELLGFENPKRHPSEFSTS